jgi:hypothetical protein
MIWVIGLEGGILFGSFLLGLLSLDHLFFEDGEDRDEIMSFFLVYPFLLSLPFLHGVVR